MVGHNHLHSSGNKQTFPFERNGAFPRLAKAIEVDPEKRFCDPHKLLCGLLRTQNQRKPNGQRGPI